MQWKSRIQSVKIRKKLEDYENEELYGVEKNIKERYFYIIYTSFDINCTLFY